MLTRSSVDFLPEESSHGAALKLLVEIVLDKVHWVVVLAMLTFGAGFLARLKDYSIEHAVLEKLSVSSFSPRVYAPYSIGRSPKRRLSTDFL